MPVHRDREKKDTTAEDMELEEQEQEASSSEEEDSDTSSVSEDGDSSGERVWKNRKWAKLSYLFDVDVNVKRNLITVLSLIKSSQSFDWTFNMSMSHPETFPIC